MKKLNIQLSRYGHQTTRRPRWVVWLLGGGVLFLAFLHLTSLWLTRSELLVAAPTDTQVAIEIMITPRNEEKLLALFENIPLVSNRPIELSDVLPYTKGKIAIFVLRDGTTALALKADLDNMPTNLLDTERVVVQDVKKGIVLLSEKLLPRSPLKKPRIRGRWIPNLLDTTVGSVYLPVEKASGALTLTDERFTLKLSGVTYPKLKHPLPSGTFAFMSTQVLPNEQLNTFIGRSEFSKELGPLFLKDGWIFLSKAQENQAFLVWSEHPDVFGRQMFIKQIIANLNPSVLLKRLQDGTTIQEISVDPDVSSIEELTVMGKTFLHARSKMGEEFFLSSDGELLFSNNEEVLRSFVENNEDSSPQICEGNSLAMNFLPILSSTSPAHAVYSQSLLQTLSNKFGSIGMKSSSKTLKVTLCK